VPPLNLVENRKKWILEEMVSHQQEEHVPYASDEE